MPLNQVAIPQVGLASWTWTGPALPGMTAPLTAFCGCDTNCSTFPAATVVVGLAVVSGGYSWRKVSPEAALADYGVVLTGSLDDDSLGFDADATAAERTGRPAAAEAFFDRGPGYAQLAEGAAYAAVDLV